MGGLPAELATRYEERGSLGKGGMGAVALARDTELDRLVAIKTMHHAGDPRALRRFQREAALLAAIDHPHVVGIYDYGVTAEGPYLVMEHLEGTPLEDLPADRDPLPPMLQIAEALEALHGAGLVHRDLKPANAFLTREGRAVLLDFGLLRDPSRTVLTRTGEVVGTPAFMAPETFRGTDDQVAPAVDWYAWGVSLFALCERRLPYTSEEVLAWITGGKGPSMRFERLDRRSPRARLIARCMSVDPARRPATRAAIEEILTEATRPEDLRGATVAMDGPPPDSLPDAGGDSVAARPVSDRLSDPAQVHRRGRTPVVAAALVALAAGWALLRPATPGDPAPAPSASPGAAEAPDARALAELGITPLEINAQGYLEVTNAIDGARMIYVPAGAFTSRTSPDIEVPGPPRRVELEGYLVDKYEVTVARFAKFTEATGHPVPDRWSDQKKYPARPVVFVDWFAAQNYCDWARGRLPSEHQWERMAGGVEGRTYPWGELPPTPADANYGKGDIQGIWTGYKKVMDTGSFPHSVSPVGALNVAGNVTEWCDTPSRLTDHHDQPLRGGNLWVDAPHLKIWIQRHWPVDEEEGNLGFRMVRDLPPEAVRALDAEVRRRLGPGT